MSSKVSQFLIDKGLLLLKERNESQFSENNAANDLLLDIENYPHAYVLGCVVDRQVPAERAWSIPYKVKQLHGNLDIDDLAKQSQEYWEEMFKKNSLHRFNAIISEAFYLAIQKIKNDYGGDASKIWSGTPTSKEVVDRFLAFKGVGLKISTMAVNILARKFGMPFADLKAIDVSPDVHIRRVFVRTGLSKTDAISDVLSSARKLYPDYPGVFDLSAWEVGKEWCRPQNPLCEKCYLNKLCPKNL